jgi:hypothetical protein
MPSTRIPGPLGAELHGPGAPATPGPLGLNDQTDPDTFALRGDTPAPVGSQDLLGRRLVSAEEWQLFIRHAPDISDVTEMFVRMGGTLPAQLIEGDFL